MTGFAVFLAPLFLIVSPEASPLQELFCGNAPKSRVCVRCGKDVLRCLPPEWPNS